MYTKLFGEIIHSTIWLEPLPHKVVFVTMLAMCDDRGEVRASTPGLARAAGVTREECEMALKSFMEPDKDSRSQEYEGRRIKEVDGGWKMLNHEKYRQLRSIEERRAYQADWMANKRKKDKESGKEIKPKKNVVSKENLPKDISEKLWHEWMGVRRSKKAINTQTAISSLITSLKKIEDHGEWSMDQAITIAIENSWKSIKLEWLINQKGVTNGQNRIASRTPTGADAASGLLHKIIDGSYS